ncbi:hypothetical protein ABPG72_020952 [Tetrahymena utriculariae]
MNKNLLNVSANPDHEEEEKQQIKIAKSEYVTGLNSTLKNTNNLQSNLIKYNNQATITNKNLNNNHDDLSNVKNPLEDEVNPLHSQYQQINTPPNPMMHNVNNPLADDNPNNYGQTNLFGNYQSQYSQPLPNYQQQQQPQGSPNQGFNNNQGYNNQQYQPPQFNSPYQQPPQQFNVQYPGQNNLSQDQAMYRSQNTNSEGFSITEDQKKYLIVGIIVCLVLIILIF